ncbi:MAG: Uma2 family endonuclease [bacterium]
MPVFVDHRLKLTYEDLQRIPEDDPYRHEILDGMHVASPSPAYRHQAISRRMQYQLYEQIEIAGKGDVVYAPADVELGVYDVVEPDIYVILSEHRDRVLPTHLRGVPDLVIEILSPSTASRDRGLKRERYEVLGVPEYWIVDPDAEIVEVYRQDTTGRSFAPPERHHEEVTYRTPTVTATVDLSKVWCDPAGRPEAGEEAPGD